MWQPPCLDCASVPYEDLGNSVPIHRPYAVTSERRPCCNQLSTSNVSSWARYRKSSPCPRSPFAHRFARQRVNGLTGQRRNYCALVERMLRATFRANARATQNHLRQRDWLEIDAESQDLPKPSSIGARASCPALSSLGLEWSGRWESNPQGRRFRSLKIGSLTRQRMPSVISV